MNLSGSILSITNRRLPNYQIGKTFRKTSIISSSFLLFSSVFVIIESPIETADFLQVAYNHGLMNGEFAFVTVDFLISHE